MKKLLLMFSCALLFSCSDSDDVITIPKEFKGLITAIGADTPAFTVLGAIDYDWVGKGGEAAVYMDSNDPSDGISDPTGFEYAIMGNGSIVSADNDDLTSAYAFPGELPFFAYTLGIFSEEEGGEEFIFAEPVEADNLAQGYEEDVNDDGRTDQLVVFAETENDLSIVRKTFVFPQYDCGADATACGLVRVLECITNNSAQTQTLNPSVFIILASGEDTELVGDAQDDGLPEQYYVATHNFASNNYPTVGIISGHVNGLDTARPAIDFPEPLVGRGAMGAARGDIDEFPAEFAAEWGAQSIEAGQRACFMQYSVIGNAANDNTAGDNPESDILKLTQDVYANSPRDGILYSEDQDIRNFGPKVTLDADFSSIEGAAKSMPADLSVKLVNKTTDQSVTITSESDGSFIADLSCDEGDEIEITAGDISRDFTCQ